MAGHGNVKEKEREWALCPWCMRVFHKNALHFRGEGSSFLKADEAFSRYTAGFTGIYRAAPFPPFFIPEEEERVIYQDGRMAGYRHPEYGQSFSKLCPICHNRINPGYLQAGRIFLLPILGGEGSGKTVFLAKLLHRLSTTAGLDYNTLFMPDTAEYFPFKEKKLLPFLKDEVFPEPNSPLEINRPLVFNVEFYNDEGVKKSSVSAVFYDISGIGLDSSIYIERYGRFFQYGSGFFVTVDSGKILGESKTDAAKEAMHLYKSLTVLKENLIDANGGQATEIPVALIVTKTDTLLTEVSGLEQLFCVAINRICPRVTDLLRCFFKNTRIFLHSVYEDEGVEDSFMWMIK